MGYNVLQRFFLCALLGICSLLNTSSSSDEINKCYVVNNLHYCFYTNVSLQLNWYHARTFCRGRNNSAMPIITDENIQNAFQQFLVDNSVFNNKDVWIAAYARKINRSVYRYWMNGRRSSLNRLNRTLNDVKWCVSMASSGGSILLYESHWTEQRHYICEYDTLPSGESCSVKWQKHERRRTNYDLRHTAASTLQQCRYACIFNPRCVVAEWWSQPSQCYLLWNEITQNWTDTPDQYELITRCDSTNFTTQSNSNCDGGIVHGSTCYKIHTERVDWFTAVNRCIVDNGQLASFDDNVRTYFPTSLLTRRTWIGLYKWRWGWHNANRYQASVLYNKFTVTGGNKPWTQNVFECATAGAGSWKGIRCTQQRPVVCQSVMPVPTTIETSVDTTTPVPISVEPTAHTTEPFPQTTSSADDSSLRENFAAATRQPGESPSQTPIIVGVVVGVLLLIIIAVVIIIIALKCRRKRNTEGREMALTDRSFPSQDRYSALPTSAPDVVYAHIVSSTPDSNTANHSAADNAVVNEKSEQDAVIYSNVQSVAGDSAGHSVAPSGDIYANVEK